MTYIDGEIITTEALRSRLKYDFGSVGGGRRLAGRLGVSASTASNLLNGNPKSSLVKVALYGFERHGDDTWIASKVSRDPRDVGYQNRWTQIVIDDLRALMSQPRDQRPRTSDVARRIGVSQSTLRGVMAKAHIRLRSEGRS